MFGKDKSTRPELYSEDRDMNNNQKNHSATEAAKILLKDYRERRQEFHHFEP